MYGNNRTALTLTHPSDREIVFTRAFDAPPNLLYEAWTNPEFIPHWMLGPEGWTMTVCDIDLRPGGEWHFQWHHSNGTDMEMHGEYREIVPNSKLVNTESWGGEWVDTINTTTFVEEHGRTIVTINVLYPTKEARDAVMLTGMKEGMSLSYQRLEEFLSSKVA